MTTGWKTASMAFAFAAATGCAVGDGGGSASRSRTADSMAAAGAESVAKKVAIQDLCWSPDGRAIYFSAMRVNEDYSDYSPGLWAVYRYETATRRATLVVPSALNAAVSPDGQALAVSKNDGDARHVVVVDRNGRNPRRVIALDPRTSAPSWSPDGTRIAYVGRATGVEAIYTANADGTNARRLTDHPPGHGAYSPAWSPDGARIVFYVSKGDGNDQVHVMMADGTGDRNLTNDEFNNIFPGWIDDRTVIYGRGRSDGPTLAYRVDLNGTEKTPVLAIESMYARYAPGGSLIACVAEREGRIRIVTDEGEPVDSFTMPPPE